ncbi:MAG: thiamine-phosphate kinase [Austwickia sp.]|nr:thiamine-phosphate kinase [Austwickia sp.]
MDSASGSGADEGADRTPLDDPELRLSAVSEEQLLALILPLMRPPEGVTHPHVLLGPGDDAAVVAAADGRFVATTDAMVRGHDWRDDWSTGADVGRKLVAQNLGDVAAMGAVPAGLLVTLLADPETTVAWVLDLARGIGAAAGAAGCAVLGGDLGGAPREVLMLSVTAFGDLQGRAPVRRSGARVGDVIAVAGSLGRSAAGFELLSAGRGDEDDAVVAGLVAAHRALVAPYAAGPAAAEAGASALIDISDGLIRDAGRVAAASGVCLALDPAALAPDVAAIEPALGPADALTAVLTGGEEHSLLGTFPGGVRLPAGFRVIGRVEAGAGVTVGGEPRSGGGWDHFAG